MSEPEKTDRRLSELGQRTAPLGARAGFAQAVMRRLDAELGWRIEVVRSAWRLLPVAMLLAVLGLAWAASSSKSSNAQLAGADIESELEW